MLEFGRCRCTIIETTDEHVLMLDVGPWDKYATMTNAAEDVAEGMAEYLEGRKLVYIDTEGRMDQILVKDGKFAGFGPWC